MLRKWAHWMVVFALVVSIGAHWAILQSVAWLGMAVSYSQNSSLTEALSKTFDGFHPCKLCKVVQEGKRSEKKQDAPKPFNKIDLIAFSATLTLEGPSVDAISFAPMGVAFPPRESPPTPPPRQIPA